MKKNILMLGGLRYLTPVIEAAHEMNLRVITADNVADNPAHRLSDEYAPVSILDRESVLRFAREREVCGIMSFAVDPGVTTAAYVAETLGLPAAGSYEAVSILQHKDRFRRFLTDNGFDAPQSAGARTLEEAISAASRMDYPLIVKPTDSAGSKGVTRVDSASELPEAFNIALSNSFSGNVIIEEFLEPETDPSDSDCFGTSGRLTTATFSRQMFDTSAPNAYTPAAYEWPSALGSDAELKLEAEINRLMELLSLRTSIYNVETRISRRGTPYIMEFSPRGGGNRLSEVVRMASGADMVRAAVCAAIGAAPDPLPLHPQYSGAWAEVILHAPSDGLFDGLEISEAAQPYVHQTDLWVNPGECVSALRGANNAIGTMVLHADDSGQLNRILKDPAQHLRVHITDYKS